MKQESHTVAACGLYCDECDIFQAASNAEIAQRIADWFKNERGVEVKIEDIRCWGCRGDRSKHWSPGCWILHCCVDGKGLGFCYECGEFPCDRLAEWAGGGKRYGEALERLKGMKPA